MKKKPSSSPSNGWMSARSSCRYSEFDSSTPARNAPSDIDSPAAEAIQAVPATVSNAVAVKTSGVRAPPISRNIRGSSTRPPSRMAPTAASPTPTSRHGSAPGKACACAASNGTRATSGMNDRSWNSSTAKPSRPARPSRSCRSPSIGSTIAVEDKARPAPSATQALQPRAVAAWISPARTAAQSAIWAEPRPNTDRRSVQSRRGRSSSPIRNSSMTTPSAETVSIEATFETIPRPRGPIATPPSR